MEFLERIKSFFYLYKSGENKEIYPFYTLRFFFFIAIFVHHCFNLVRVDFLRQPALAVSGFIVLSGYLNAYMYLNKYKLNLKEIFNFTVKRIKKFYLLHIFMLLISVIYTGVFNYSKVSEFVLFFKKLLTNITLTQSWVSDKGFYFGFNGATWFLSTYLFLTIITIPLLHIIKRIKESKHGSIKLVLLSLILVISSFAIVYYININNINKEYWIYIFPPARAIEYSVAMIIGSLAPRNIKPFKGDKPVFTIFEICSVLLVALTVINVKNSLILDGRFNIYLMPLLLLFYIFSFQRGYISLLLSNKVTVYLGKISMYMFIVHQPLIILLSRNVVHYRYLALYMLILTIVFSSLINKFYKKNI